MIDFIPLGDVDLGDVDLGEEIAFMALYDLIVRSIACAFQLPSSIFVRARLAPFEPPMHWSRQLPREL